MAASIEIHVLIHSLFAECKAHPQARLLLNVGMRGPEHVGLLSYESSGHVGRLLLVGVRVFHHPVLADEALATHVAGERLLARVKAHVASQIGFVVELFGTDFTLVRLVSRVLGEVFLVQQLHWKSLPALSTFKGLFSIVETFIMLLQVTDFLEYFVAFIAPEFAKFVV